MTRMQRLRTCGNLLQLANATQDPRLQKYYRAQLIQTLSRLKTKNDLIGVGADQVTQ